MSTIIKKINRVLISDNFYLDEFVPKTMIDKFGRKAIFWVRKEQVLWAEFFRKIYGATIVNSYAFIDNGLQDCGYRLPNSKTGAEYSQHKSSNADDLHFVRFNGKGIDAYNQVREDILKEPKKFLEIGITTIEAGTHSWLHIDGRNTSSIVEAGKILVVPFK